MNFEQPQKKEKILLDNANREGLLNIIAEIQKDEDLYKEYYMFACEGALAYMKENDAEYFDENFSGTFIDKNNGMMYLLDKKGEETSLTPEQAFGQAPGTEEVYRNAIKKLLEKHPEKAETLEISQ